MCEAKNEHGVVTTIVEVFVESKKSDLSITACTSSVERLMVEVARYMHFSRHMLVQYGSHSCNLQTMVSFLHKALVAHLLW